MDSLFVTQGVPSAQIEFHGSTTVSSRRRSSFAMKVAASSTLASPRAAKKAHLERVRRDVAAERVQRRVHKREKLAKQRDHENARSEWRALHPAASRAARQKHHDERREGQVREAEEELRLLLEKAAEEKEMLLEMAVEKKHRHRTEQERLRAVAANEREFRQRQQTEHRARKRSALVNNGDHSEALQALAAEEARKHRDDKESQRADARAELEGRRRREREHRDDKETQRADARAELEARRRLEETTKHAARADQKAQRRAFDVEREFKQRRAREESLAALEVKRSQQQHVEDDKRHFEQEELKRRASVHAARSGHRGRRRQDDEKRQHEAAAAANALRESLYEERLATLPYMLWQGAGPPATKQGGETNRLEHQPGDEHSRALALRNAAHTVLDGGHGRYHHEMGAM